MPKILSLSGPDGSDLRRQATLPCRPEVLCFPFVRTCILQDLPGSNVPAYASRGSKDFWSYTSCRYSVSAHAWDAFDRPPSCFAQRALSMCTSSAGQHISSIENVGPTSIGRPTILCGCSMVNPVLYTELAWLATWRWRGRPTSCNIRTLSVL